MPNPNSNYFQILPLQFHLLPSTTTLSITSTTKLSSSLQVRCQFNWELSLVLKSVWDPPATHPRKYIWASIAFYMSIINLTLMPKFSFNMLQLVNKTGLTQLFLYSQIFYDKEQFKNFKIIIPAIIGQHYR